MKSSKIDPPKPAARKMSKDHDLKVFICEILH